MAKWIELNNSITIRCDAIYALEKKHSFGQYYICIAVANQNTPYEFCFGENKVACEHKYNELKRDLPYGTTHCEWDVIIPFELLWKHYNRIIKDNGAIVLFGSGLFTAELMCSNNEYRAN